MYFVLAAIGQRYQYHTFLALYHQLMEAGRGGVGAYLSNRKGGDIAYSA
jgi:hypothetical protein